MISLVLCICALGLDLWLKDPPRWPHPVRLLGWMLLHLEALARTSRLPLRLWGAAVTLGLGGTVWAVVWLLTSLPLLGWLFWLYFAYAGLALGGLLHAGREVAALLRAQDITAARAALAGLVSRDVRTMDEQGLRRTLAETISENLNDAFVAPFLYLVCLGPAGLWAYKTVSTMDSMWGYTTVQWRELGWAAARADDLLAFVPARLSALSLMAAHWLSGHGHRISWSELRRTAAKTDSPNAGWPMAACALLLQTGMGGPTPYFGQIRHKPLLGPHPALWTDAKLAALLKLCGTAGLLFAAMSLATLFFIMLAGL